MVIDPREARGVSIRHLLVTLAVILGPGAAAALQPAAITVAGATSLLPYARAVIGQWSRDNPSTRVALTGGGSLGGWYALRLGRADIALSDIPFSPGTALKELPIGKMPVLLVINRQAGVSNLTMGALRRVWRGQVRRWSQLGGRKAAVRLVVRQAGSGARHVIDARLGAPAPDVLQIVQLSNGAVVRTVSEMPGAVGYVEGDRPWLGVVVCRIDGQAYRPGGPWPLYALPRLYFPASAGPAIWSLSHALASSPRKTGFGIVPAARRRFGG